MRRLVRLVMLVGVLAGALVAVGAGPAAAAAEHETWDQVVDSMAAELDQARDLYAAGELEAARDQVDVAYFSYYEKLGFEKTVMSYISGARAAEVEYQFASVKKAILADAGEDEVAAGMDTLVGMLRTDAAVLDGDGGSTPWATFLASLGIILREGIEAILVVAAVVAYLVKSGNRDKVRAVVWGVGAALVASVVLAVLLNAVTHLQGANQEIIEAVTMLVAVAMLVYVSHWVLSRSEHQAWEAYISRATDRSLSRGSVLSLAFVAFLAVFREGAETILFYAALLAGSASDHPGMIWLGLGAGAALLVVVYVLIDRLSVRVPLRPFFLATSVLLAAMAFVFTGHAIKELQEGNAVAVTPVPWLRSVEWLGVFPTAQTLAAQGAVLAVLVALAVIQVRRSRRLRSARASDADEAARAVAAP